jgi:dUTP pyrophosphatase
MNSLENEMRYSNTKKSAEDPLWATPIKKELEGMDLLVKFKKLSETATIPEYKTKDAAGLDVSSNVDLVIKSGKFLAVATGLSMELPRGYEAQIRPRSGLAAKNGVTVLNSPGTIDADYRGEVKIILINHGEEDFVIKSGDRIAQMVIAAVEQAKIVVVTDELSSTDRGTGGFGSTGVR